MSEPITSFREIPLTQGKVAIVDEQDYAILSQYKWQALRGTRKKTNRWYAVRSVPSEQGIRRTLKMHRVILGLTDPKIQTDHRNGNGLDNRRCNIRPASNGQNMANRDKAARNTSGYKGVYKRGQRWCAKLSRRFLGSFDTAEEAARTYDAVALKLYGEFARLNFSKDSA